MAAVFAESFPAEDKLKLRSGNPDARIAGYFDFLPGLVPEGF